MFSIRDALTEINPITGKHFLVNYYYHISKVSLNGEETQEYKKLTRQMTRLANKAETDPQTAECYDRLVEVYRETLYSKENGAWNSRTNVGTIRRKWCGNW